MSKRDEFDVQINAIRLIAATLTDLADLEEPRRRRRDLRKLNFWERVRIFLGIIRPIYFLTPLAIARDIGERYEETGTMWWHVRTVYVFGVRVMRIVGKAHWQPNKLAPRPRPQRIRRRRKL